jgi:hypothetical protein
MKPRKRFNIRFNKGFNISYNVMLKEPVTANRRAGPMRSGLAADARIRPNGI